MNAKQNEKFSTAVQLERIQDNEYDFPYHYVSKFREGFSQIYNDNWAINYVSTIEYILGRIRNEAVHSIADIGCGDGRLTAELTTEFPQKQIIGIDYSERAISLAKLMSPQCTFYASDIIANQQSNTFDAALLIEVFEHISPDIAPNFVSAVADLIKPEGFLLVTVPHTNKPVEYKHYRHFSAKSLTESFESHFEVIEMVPFEKISWRMTAIKTILSNRFFVLNHRRTKNWLYRYYKNKLFETTENDCQRLFAKLEKLQ